MHAVLFVTVLLLTALLGGCASGGLVTPRGGDGGHDSGAGQDAAARDASSSEAGPAEDAASGTADAGVTATRDGGATDAGLDAGLGVGRDAGLDAGRDAGACPAGASMSCATSCGTTGTSTCSGGAWGPCVPPAETCNGRDDDCDADADEGFRASVVSVSYSGDLASRHDGCDGTRQRMGTECNAAIHRFCAARGCTSSGFGPDENSGDLADVTCVVADVRNPRYSGLSTYHGGCTATSRWGPDCNAAIHRYCQAMGFASGFGPVENSGDDAYVACVRAAVVQNTTYSVLATHHPGCDGTRQRMGPDCNAAIHRFCRSLGYESGFGPAENSGDDVVVACVRR